MSYVDFWNELVGAIPKLSAPLAQTIINRAWVDIQKARFWSFLRGTTTLLVPNMIDTGTVAVTQFSNTVQCDATTMALLNAETNPLITTRQFRTGFGNPIYSIWGYDATTGIITLDRPFTEPTNAASAYVVYRCYYTVPCADFKKWETVTNMVDPYPLSLSHTRQELERIDPQRSSATASPYWVTAWQSDNNPNSPTYKWPMYELYEHPTTAMGLQATFQRYGAEFASDTDDVILPVTASMLMERAYYFAYQWAEANKGRVVELRGSNWLNLMLASDARYKGMLKEASLADEEIFGSDVIYEDGSQLGFLADANYQWNHDV